MSGTADGLVVFEGPADLAVLNAQLPALFLADAKSSERFWEFFAANIRNRNTRRAYAGERIEHAERSVLICHRPSPCMVGLVHHCRSRKESANDSGNCQTCKQRMIQIN
jgi:hypothetical protein